ncbi:MAG: TolC family protein [Deltaproteobacteria bacterium]|nr:TolC family protein [Deltaproteobacteria bacterium]
MSRTFLGSSSLAGLFALTLAPTLAHAQDATIDTAPGASASAPPIAPAAALDLDARLGAPNGLRASDVARAVIETSHDRRARLAEVAAARTEIDRATYGYVPRVGVTIGYSRLSEIDQPSLGVLAAPADQSARGPLPAGAPLIAIPLRFPVILDQTQIRAQLVVPLTDYFLRVMPAHDAAEHGVDAAEAMVEVTERRLGLEAETLYWSWVRASLGIVVAQQALAAAEAHRDDATRLVRAGMALEVDLARAEAQVAAMRELVGTAEHARDAASDRLRTIMHVDHLSPEVGDRLDPSDASRDLEGDVSAALASRAELRALDAQLAATDAQRTIVLAGMLPRVDLVGEALLANPNPRYVPQTERFDFTWQVGAQASWQLADTLAGDASQRALDARVEALRESRDVAREGIRAEVVDAHRALVDAALATETRRAQVDAAERTLDQASAVYRVGRGNGLVVIDAQTLLVRARLDLLAARIDARVAEARRRRAISEE